MKPNVPIKVAVSFCRFLSRLRIFAKFSRLICKSFERALRSNRASPLTGREILQDELL